MSDTNLSACGSEEDTSQLGWSSLMPRGAWRNLPAAVAHARERRAADAGLAVIHGRRITALLTFVLGLALAGTPGAQATKKPPPTPVNINSATAEQLQQVPGIGPATAEKILQMRKSYGPFKSVDDLLAIKGIGKKRLDKMRKYLTVGKPAAPQKNTPPSAKPTPPKPAQPPTS
jgi:competence protein ComEA